MRLQRLTALESDKVRDEHAELMKTIGELRAILGDEKRIDGVISDRARPTSASATRDPRRTDITFAEGEVDIEDMIADQQMVISLTASGYAKRLPLATYRQQHRGGKGVSGMNLKEGDYIEHLHICSTHDFLLFFTNRGKVYRLKVYELPEGSRDGARQGARQRPAAPRRREGDGRDPDPRLHRGQVPGVRDRRRPVKKTEFTQYNTPIRADGIIAIKVRDGDELVQVRLTSGEDDILMVSRSGKASRFSEEKVRAMGRDTSGVQGMNVSDKVDGTPNRVLAMDIARPETDVFVVTENGYGKRTADRGLPGQGPRNEGQPDREADREEGRPGRRDDRPRAPGPAVHLRQRDGPADVGQGDLADGPGDARASR